MAGLWGLKTGTYATDVTVNNYASISVELDSLQASKIGDAKNEQRLVDILITDLQIDSSFLDSKLTITSDVANDKVTLDYINLREPWERLAFLQHIRLLTKQLSDDVTIIKEKLLEIINVAGANKLVLNATPIVTVGNTQVQLVFDVISGYPVDTAGLLIYEQMFKEWVSFCTDAGIDILLFGSGADDWIMAAFDNPSTPATWTVTFDLTDGSQDKVQMVTQIIAICQAGITNTYETLKDAGAVLAA